MNDFVDFASLRAARTGYSVSGAGTPVVLLHSSLSHKGQWQALSADLARNCTIAVDLIGHGDAIAGGPEATLDDEARAIASVLRGILGQIPAFHLVGHSYGGGVALRLARNLPHCVKSLALYEPTAFHVLPGNDPGRGEIEQIVAVMSWAMKREAPDAAIEMFIDYWAGIGAYSALPTHLRVLFTRMAPIVLANFRALLDEPATLDDYSRLTMPVCLISGDASPQSSRRVAAWLARAFACCEQHRIEGGHMAPVTHAQQVNPIIARFIETVESCAPRTLDDDKQVA